MNFRSHTVLAAIVCVLLSPVGSLAAPKNLPNPSKTGQSLPSAKGLKNDPSTFDFDGRSAGRALQRRIGDDLSTTRGGAEAEIYRRISPSVVLVLTKDGLGSGSLINADGTIITNYHVVAGYREVGILFKPQNEGDRPDVKKVMVADVIKIDEVADLALLKLRAVTANFPPPVALGDFSKVSVGDDVNAIGHPTGETWTFTRGYVSQIRRNYEWKIENNMVHKADVIQTQTPINPGNSGGPLLNTAGQLVGINAFKDDGEGLNFAIGITTMQEFLKRKGDRGGDVTVATTGGGAAQTGSKNACKPQATFKGRDEKNTKTIVEYDRNCNGVADLTYEKPDDKNEPACVYVDEDENGKPEGMILSYKQDDYFNVSYWDSNGDGEVDTIGYHPDGKLKPSSFGPYIDSKS